MMYRIALAGSTSHTVQCAQALLRDPKFEIPWILTPAPKPIGRKHIITPNPLHQFAIEHQIPVILVEKKIDEKLQQQLPSDRPEFLLVVDFGYLIPKWLLELPLQAPLNIHPSDLPRWRGSSPGQFVLLYGEMSSQVSLMIMNEGLDTGPILYKQPLVVLPTWTQTEYYFESFDQIGKVVPMKIKELAEHRLEPQPQPSDSPTPLTQRLSKEDGFVPWSIVKNTLTESQSASASAPPTAGFPAKAPTSPLLQEAVTSLGSWAICLEHATRALSPWPLLWTLIPTADGSKRMQILKSHLEPSSGGQLLVLDQVRIEGHDTQAWRDIQALILK